MKERWLRGAGGERDSDDDAFDAVVAGRRHGLSRERALAMWEHARADATDAAGRCDAVVARQAFHVLATRTAGPGGRLVPEMGKWSRVELEIDDEARDRWRGGTRSAHAPGRTTRVGAE